MNETSRQKSSSTQHKKSTEDSPLVEVTKNYKAPVDEVFKVWSDENLIREWWGPEDFTCPYAQNDFKEGGKYLFAMKKKDDENKIFWTTGKYEEIVPNERIVYSDQFADEKGNLISPEQAGFEWPWPNENGLCFVTVEFESLEDGVTKLTLSHEGIPANMHDECVDGWSSSLDKIKPLVERH